MEYIKIVVIHISQKEPYQVAGLTEFGLESRYDDNIGKRCAVLIPCNDCIAITVVGLLVADFQEHVDQL